MGAASQIQLIHNLRKEEPKGRQMMKAEMYRSK